MLVSTGCKDENVDWNNASYLSLYIRPTDGDADDAVQWLLQDEQMMLRLLVLRYYPHHCLVESSD